MKRCADSLGVTMNCLLGASDMAIPDIKASRHKVLQPRAQKSLIPLV